MCYKTDVDLKKAKLLSSDPVMVITTVDEKGVNNAAAFGSYMRIGSTVIVAVSPESDTWRNVKATGEFVINVPARKDLESIMRVSRHYGPDEDDIALSGLRAEKSVKVKAPTIVEYPACVECRLSWIKEMGSHSLVAAEMIHARCDEAFLDDQGRFDQVKAGVLHVVRYPDPVYIGADRYLQGIEKM